MYTPAGRTPLPQSGRTPLHWAARSGNTGLISALIAAGTPLCSQDSFGRTAVHEAVLSGRVEAVRTILAAIAAQAAVMAASAGDEAKRPCCTEVGRVSRAALPSSSDAEAAVRAAASAGDRRGRTPMSFAAACNLPGIAVALLEVGVSSTEGRFTPRNEPPPCAAARRGNSDVLRAMLSFAADSSRRADEPARAANIGRILNCAKKGEHHDINPSYRTALGLALQIEHRDSVPCVEALVERVERSLDRRQQLPRLQAS